MKYHDALKERNDINILLGRILNKTLRFITYIFSLLHREFIYSKKMQMFMPDTGLNDPMGLMGVNFGYAYVNALQYRINLGLLKTGDVEYIVAKFLSDLIIEAEAIFESDGKRLKLEKEFMRRFMDEWLPLRRQIFEELICLGIYSTV